MSFPPCEILVSAGEASGDLYAAGLVEALRTRLPEARFFGCTGPRMRAAGVETVVDAASLSVVGLVEVVRHIPRIYGEYRTLLRAAATRRPRLAILTDSPDFHLRVARQLHRRGIPVHYLVAPQAWAWRKGRIPSLRRDVARLHCIFPFEQEFFRKHGVAADYIGHPLTRIVRPTAARAEFRRKFGFREGVPLILLLPGSRAGEVHRHLPILVESVRRIRETQDADFALVLPETLVNRQGAANFREPIRGSSIQLLEGDAWNAMAAADLALAASGTVTVEAAILGLPMVTFYRVTEASWWMGRFLVDVPYYTMVNLVAGRQVVPELMQNDMTPDRIAAEAVALLKDGQLRARMKQGLAEVRDILATENDPLERAASLVMADPALRQ